MKEVCSFCNNLEGNAENVARVMPEFAGSGLCFAKPPHLSAVAELHPVVDDPYFLIVSQEHVEAFTHLHPSCDREIQEMGVYLQNLCGKESFVVFEHGDQEFQQARSVTHGHTHLIPTDTSYLPHIERELKERGVAFTELTFNGFGTIRTLRRMINFQQGYLFFRQGDYGLLVPESRDVEFPKQMFRRMIAKIDNPLRPFIDWKSLSTEEKRVLQQRLARLPREAIKE